MKDRIMKCFAIEMSCSEIYKSFANMFPEGRTLWETLSRQEEDHAKFLIAGDYLKFIGEGHGQVTLPPSALAEKMSVFLDGVGSEIENGMLAIRDAFDRSVKIEESFVESYIFEIETLGNESVVADFKRLLVGEETHLDMIRDFMSKKGYLKSH